MSWFADLAGKAESLLNNLDEQTGAALRNHNALKPKKHEFQPETSGQKRRPALRNTKKTVPAVDNRSTNTPSRKSSPTSHQSRSLAKETQEFSNVRNRKSPSRKANNQYTLNNCPRTLIEEHDGRDASVDHFGLRQRRYSLPSDLEILNTEAYTYRMQNLEVENAMLKNELNVVNREMADMLDRLRKTEDELTNTQTKLQKADLLNHTTNLEKESLTAQLNQVQLKLHEVNNVEINKYKESYRELEIETTVLKDKNRELEEKVKNLTEQLSNKETAQAKLENELRHAQSVNSELQGELEKSTGECRRLEKDWESYKLRVKGMLYAKDNEIKLLRDGTNISEDTKMLMEELEKLKEERDELSSAISLVRDECSDMRESMSQLEARRSAAERALAGLRDALRDERAARNRADAQCSAVGKEYKSMQIEMGQTIASLRTALQNKEDELQHLRDSSSTVPTSDTSALNVADYDVTRDSLENDKITYLTETLVQRQGKIDKLLADNNILRIQLEKLESKYKTEMASRRLNHTHSVIHVQDENRNRTRYPTPSPLSKLSVRLGVILKRFPLFRIFIIFYMIGLHFWVLTVLFTSTPESYGTRPIKS
ncbi:uncharacterized protein [Epargyreus clarus]|uniref:uncharacterized protein n=1 Tax=Epargyreus clarus TaxID=520877 RepID=UPI003C2E49E8